MGLLLRFGGDEWREEGAWVMVWAWERDFFRVWRREEKELSATRRLGGTHRRGRTVDQLWRRK